jgi:hypothetical protein
VKQKWRRRDAYARPLAGNGRGREEEQWSIKQRWLSRSLPPDKEVGEKPKKLKKKFDKIIFAPIIATCSVTSNWSVATVRRRRISWRRKEFMHR